MKQNLYTNSSLFDKHTSDFFVRVRKIPTVRHRFTIHHCLLLSLNKKA